MDDLECIVNPMNKLRFLSNFGLRIINYKTSNVINCKCKQINKMNNNNISYAYIRGLINEETR